MSPKFYGFVWILFFASAGIAWVAGMLTLTTIIVLGLVAFGLVFTGMMCVLPGAVSHPPSRQARRANTPVERSTAGEEIVLKAARNVPTLRVSRISAGN